MKLQEFMTVLCFGCCKSWVTFWREVLSRLAEWGSFGQRLGRC